MITKNEKGNLVISTTLFYEGEHIINLQESLSLAIEEIGSSDNSRDNDYKRAMFFLSELLRSSFLSQSEANVGIGGRPYKSTKKELGTDN